MLLRKITRKKKYTYNTVLHLSQKIHLEVAPCISDPCFSQVNCITLMQIMQLSKTVSVKPTTWKSWDIKWERQITNAFVHSKFGGGKKPICEYSYAREYSYTFYVFIKNFWKYKHLTVMSHRFSRKK